MPIDTTLTEQKIQQKCERIAANIADHGRTEGTEIATQEEMHWLALQMALRGVFAFLWNGDLDDEFPCNAPTHEWAKVIGNIYDDPKLLKRH